MAGPGKCRFRATRWTKAFDQSGCLSVCPPLSALFLNVHRTFRVSQCCLSSFSAKADADFAQERDKRSHSTSCSHRPALAPGPGLESRPSWADAALFHRRSPWRRVRRAPIPVNKPSRVVEVRRYLILFSRGETADERGRGDRVRSSLYARRETILASAIPE